MDKNWMENLRATVILEEPRKEKKMGGCLKAGLFIFVGFASGFCCLTIALAGGG